MKNKFNYHNKNEPKKGFFDKRKQWKNLPSRSIFSNVPDLQIPPNKIVTSKYTALSFIPKNLIEQFYKLANVYFLIIGMLQMIKSITNTNGQPLLFVPLFLVVAISMLKDFLEDQKRKRSDREENNSKVEVLDGDSFKIIFWKNLRVGNIVKIYENQYFPADVIILKTSDNKKHTCFIETKNLDGETNLKQRYADPTVASFFSINQLNFSFKNNFAAFNFEKPNPYLYTFYGNMSRILQKQPTMEFLNDETQEKIPLCIQNFILRGCSLKNTEFIIGLVAYNGHDTKIMLNSISARSKQSHIFFAMNFQIFIIFTIQIIICIICSILYLLIYESKKDFLQIYLEIALNDVTNSYMKMFFIQIGTWLLLFANFIPISLIVTLETVKFLQAKLIQQDNNCKSKELGIPCQVQSSSLNEELGQVQYIFSDKTGTLTKNIMEFKKIIVGGRLFGDERNMTQFMVSQRSHVTNVDFLDKSFFDELDKTTGNIIQQQIKECLQFISLCHTILSEEKEGEIVYNASSPDELALVNWAKFCGCSYIGIDEANNIIINNLGTVEKYKLLHVLEFNSSRKRMSVLLQQQNGEILLYCKGADSIILERLNQQKIDEEKQQIRAKTEKYLDKMASIGLRTLLLAKRSINQEEFQKWNEKFMKIKAITKNREEQMDELMNQIEIDMEIVGGTAIEDKLQDEVGKTISLLKQADIKVWVLTGDKIETAINIGISCNLLDEEMEQIIIDQDSEEQMAELFEKYYQVVRSSQQKSFAIIISGQALIKIMERNDLKEKLILISDFCKSVVACRVSPKQKAEVVDLIRKQKPKAITLAIGDGANDVNMITKAHIGIGIKGVEGQQAARASDYSIGEFKILKRLTLYVGRESYRKNSQLIFYNFYKNILIVLPQFWLGIYNQYTGQIMYISWMYQLYNVIFTAVPIIIYSLFDEQYPNSQYLDLKNSQENYLERNPQTYELGQKNKLFNSYQFWLSNFNSILQTFIIFFIWKFSLNSFVFTTQNGRTISFFIMGTVIFTSVVIIVNLKILYFSYTINFFSIIFIILSIAVYFIILLALSLFFTTNTFEAYHIIQIKFSSIYFYIGLIITILFIMILIMYLILQFCIITYQVLENYQFKKIFPLQLVTQKQQIKMIELPTKLAEFQQKFIRKGTLNHGFAFSQDEPQEYYKKQPKLYQDKNDISPLRIQQSLKIDEQKDIKNFKINPINPQNVNQEDLSKSQESQDLLINN